MYYVTDAIETLKKYGYYTNAEIDIKRKKIASAPYDMKGHYDVYCTYLSKIWAKLRDQISELQSIDCVEWDQLPGTDRPLHKDCNFVYISNSYCDEKCKYYQEKLKPLVEEKNKIAQMIKDLKKTAEEDYYLR